MKRERMQWFDDFKKGTALTSKSIMEFHKTAGNGEKDYGVIMDRFFVKTTSITQIIKSNKEVSMSFENLLLNSKSELSFNMPLSVNE